MALLSEQVRQLSSEESLIDDESTYTRDNAAWGTLKDYGSILLTEPTLIVWRANFNSQSCYRIKIGAYYIWGNDINSGSEVGSYMGLAYVDAGTHAVVVEQKNGAGSGTITSFKLGKASFSDQTGQTATTYSSEINITVADRTTCIGPLKDAVFAVHVFAKTAGAQTNFENPGDSLTNGVSLTVDSSQITWTERNQDTNSRETASATYYCIVSVGSQHTFQITKDNANTQVDITIYACPWILSGSNHEPVALNVSQGSTIYIGLEPLSGNITKFVGVGKKRAVSFGDTTDYYSTDSGTDLKTFNYTFETVSPNETPVHVNGFTPTDPDGTPSGGCGCIGYIGVDVR